jgi:hypothetical protein
MEIMQQSEKINAQGKLLESLYKEINDLAQQIVNK